MSVHWISWLRPKWLSLVAALVFSPTFDFERMYADEANSDAATEISKRRLEQMHSRGKATTVRFADGRPKRTVELRPEPILRYDDRLRGFRDASVWLCRQSQTPIIVPVVSQ